MLNDCAVTGAHGVAACRVGNQDHERVVRHERRQQLRHPGGQGPHGICEGDDDTVQRVPDRHLRSAWHTSTIGHYPFV